MEFQMNYDEDYQIQKRKRIRVQRPHQRQTVTGLIVNEKLNLPRTTRRRIRAMQHHRRKGILSSKDQAKLAGYEALQQMVNEVRQHNRLENAEEEQSDIMNQDPISILFLAANPSDSTRLRLDAENRAIDLALLQSEYRERFQVNQHWAVRVDDLQGILLRHKPDIIHFCGHGDDRSAIVLEDAHGQSHPISSQTMSRLFSILKDNIKCVILNACYSEAQALEISQHIDCVIGMSKQITDDAAINFATAFYQALGYGRNMKTAFELGCVQIDMHNLEEYDAPKLLAPHVDPEQIVFAKP